jgi:hypothetical protein
MHDCGALRHSNLADLLKWSEFGPRASFNIGASSHFGAIDRATYGSHVHHSTSIVGSSSSISGASRREPVPSAPQRFLFSFVSASRTAVLKSSSSSVYCGMSPRAEPFVRFVDDLALIESSPLSATRTATVSPCMIPF